MEGLQGGEELHMSSTWGQDIPSCSASDITVFRKASADEDKEESFSLHPQCGFAIHDVQN